MAQSVQMMNPTVGIAVTPVPALSSSNEALTRSLKAVCNLSIATLVFSIILFLLGVISIFVPQILLFSVGTIVAFNCFWVTIPVGFSNNQICRYRSDIRPMNLKWKDFRYYQKLLGFTIIYWSMYLYRFNSELMTLQ